MSRWLQISLLLFTQLSFGQSTDDFDLEKFTERLFSVQTNDINYEDLYEQYLQWYLNPLDLNNASGEDFRSLYLLSNKQITAFMKYRDDFGPIMNFNELQTIEGFSPAVLRDLRPFVQISLKSEPRNHQKSFILLQSKRVFQNNLHTEFSGIPYRMFMRNKTYLTSKSNFGIALENDPGENLRWSPKSNSYLFDHTSFHYQLQSHGVIRNLVVGDFQAQFGQGLVLGSGFYLGKGAETVSTVRKSNLGFRPYTSLVESGFFRGIGFTLGNNKLKFSGMLSRTSEDANISVDSAGATFVARILTSGYHRTDAEIDRKGSQKRNLAGINITYDVTSKLQVGATGTYTILNIPVLPDSTYYNGASFRGTSNSNVGIYGSYNWRNISVFSEFARSASGGNGLVLGGIFSVGESLDVSFHLRKYDRDFHALYASVFSESSNFSGERGAYLGLAWKPLQKLKVNAYWDKFSYSWLRYRTFSTSGGLETLIRVSYDLQSNTSIYLQFRSETKPRNIDTQSPVQKVSDGTKRNLLLNSDYEIAPGLNMKTRLQYSTYQITNQQSEGIAFIQDMNIDKGRVGFGLRIAVFDTQDYENRQYAYERDVLYSFSIPAYYGTGIRTVLLSKVNISRSMNAWFRMAYTKQGNGSVSGRENQFEAKFQLRCQF